MLEDLIQLFTTLPTTAPQSTMDKALRVLMLALTIPFTLLLIAAISFIDSLKTAAFNRDIMSALQPIFPDVSGGKGYGVVFHILDLNSSIDFISKTSYSLGQVIFTVNFLENPPLRLREGKKSKNNRQKYNTIFALNFMDKDFFVSGSSEASLEKCLKITSDDPVLKQTLAGETKLLNALRNIYLAADGNEIEFVLERDCITITCFKYITDPEILKRFAVNSVKAIREGLKTAEHANIRLVIDNPINSYPAADLFLGENYSDDFPDSRDQSSGGDFSPDGDEISDQEAGDAGKDGGEDSEARGQGGDFQEDPRLYF